MSHKFPTPITPAGWTFSIWGPIFLLQGSGVLYAVFSKSSNDDEAGTLNQIYKNWFATWMFTIAWQIFFMQETKIGMILASCVIAFTASHMNAASVIARHNARNTWAQTVCVSLPSSIYAGWATLATTVQFLVVGFAYDVSHDALVKASFALLAVVLVISMFQIFAAKDVFFVIPIVWGLLGVDGGATDDSIHVVAKTGAAVVAAAGLIELCIQVFSHMQTRPKNRENFVVVDKAGEPLLAKP